jgi:hypothetical protein
VSNLNDCDITGNFYGGGNLGKVDGTITSTLNGCRIGENVFGAGYSASRPKVSYRNGGFASYPSIDTNAGVFIDGVKSTNVDELELNPGQTLSDATTAIGTAGKIDTNFTEADLNSLGTVASTVTLNITDYTEGSTTKKTEITGHVFGGGDSSAVTGDIKVTLEGDVEVHGNVYGGGNQGLVQGSTEVNIKE